MSILYSRRTPFGFVNPANATDEDLFYGEEVNLPKVTEGKVLATADALRGLLAESGSIQTLGFDSQSQAEDMAELLLRIKVAS